MAVSSIEKITPKKALLASLFALAFAFIIVLTVVPVVFDLEHFDWQRWMTNSLIAVGIMVFSIFLGEVFGEDKQKEKLVLERDAEGNPTGRVLGGLYQKALYEFNEVMRAISDMGIDIYFSQFFVWFKARELKNKREGYLVDKGFDQVLAHMIVSFIEPTDVDDMCRAPLVKTTKKGKAVKFRRMTEYECDAIRTIFTDEITMDAPDYTYFLSANADSDSKYVLEEGKKLDRKEQSNKRFNRTFKIIFSLVISVIWGAATIKDVIEGGAKSVVINLVMRMLALFGGIMSGYLTSVTTVKLEARKLENKAKVLTFFKHYYDSKEFVPLSYEEMVDAEIAEEEKKKAEAIESVIDPELEDYAKITLLSEAKHS